MRDPRHDILFEPVPIGPVTLPNRFYQVPHCTGFGVTKPFTQAAHRGMKADGGWGAVCTEYCSISPAADDEPYVSVAPVGRRRRGAAAADDRGRARARRAGRGRAVARRRAWRRCARARLPTLAPSQIANEHLPWNVPQAMTAADIRREQDAWVTAARRAVDAGFDIVYVYGVALLPADAVPLAAHNRRTDAYGGSLENRARFWLEAIERVRRGRRRPLRDRRRASPPTRSRRPASSREEGAAFVRAADPFVDLWDAAIGADAGESAPTPARRAPTSRATSWS